MVQTGVAKSHHPAASKYAWLWNVEDEISEPFSCWVPVQSLHALPLSEKDEDEVGESDSAKPINLPPRVEA